MTDQTADIRIPLEHLPADGRFGSGPSKVRVDALRALAETGTSYMGTSHRQKTVKDMVGRARTGLSRLLGLPDGHEVLLGNGGATAFWDVAGFRLVREHSHHAVFGEFSSKFAQAMAEAPHIATATTVEADPGSHPEVTAVAGADAYALTQNETSTGVCMPVARPAGADPDAVVLVDATSAAGGMAVDAAEFDVYYLSPQKALASDGGLWLAACSPRALQRIDELATPFVADPAMRSPVVVTIDLDERVDATQVCSVLRANGVVDTDSYRKLGRNQIRVATFPAVTPDDTRQLTACLDYVMEILAR